MLINNFIDEINMLPKDIQVHIYSLMTDNKITLVTKGVIQSIDVVPLTVIGATNYMGALDSAFRSRFPLPIKFNSYKVEELKIIISENAKRLKVILEPEALEMLALNCQRSPRISQNLIITSTRISEGTLNGTDVTTMFRLMKIFPDGMYVPQINILYALSKAENGSLGLNTFSKNGFKILLNWLTIQNAYLTWIKLVFLLDSVNEIMGRLNFLNNAD